MKKDSLVSPAKNLFTGSLLALLGCYVFYLCGILLHLNPVWVGFAGGAPLAFLVVVLHLPLFDIRMWIVEYKRVFGSQEESTKEEKMEFTKTAFLVWFATVFLLLVVAFPLPWWITLILIVLGLAPFLTIIGTGQRQTNQ